MNDYGIDIWGDDNFIIKNGKVCLKYGSEPAIIDIVNTLLDDGYKGPIILRFNHLIKKQIEQIYINFNNAIKEFDYRGSFNAVYPLKVNQFPGFVKSLVKLGKNLNYGLEAGSKGELLLAMAYNNENAPITVNGFKDKELITMGFIAAEMGHNITLTIEGINELEVIIKTAKERFGIKPKIGLRVRLHSLGSGTWAKSGGINSKFGLTSTELIEAVGLLKENDLLDCFTMIHFHIGSQINEIHPLKKALSEAGNIYFELRKMGANNLENIDIGGGLAIEYSQFQKTSQRNYTLSEYANDIVFILKTLAAQKQEIEPNIYIESGRFVSGSHAVLVAPVLELFSQEYSESKMQLKEKNPQLIDELCDLYKNIKPSNAVEYMHDSYDHLDSILTLFDLGYVDLQDRSNAEILVHLIGKKAVSMLSPKHLLRTQKEVQERYLVNFSMFQSLPDFWGLGQEFPIMPLDRLDTQPTRSASIWDITCDSDGEISFDAAKRPLFLHDVDVEQEDYFLGFFLVGAYQEVLGMKHNLFTHPTQVSIDIDDKGYEIESIIESQSIRDILEDLDYDIREIDEKIQDKINSSELINEKTKKHILGELFIFMHDNGYLKKI
ncbi:MULTISPECIES: biosynthetic arginine decarboxylase [unclassified Campylobacter]|uniref:biosynthetic arginine decarboxylase n=1 Tax=unclassified Campylobacter TaxID=2593542 RepID=UPI001BDA0A02|nr:MULTISPECIES: biosynthetic arginine decarboxylase [unclassified Campylobacter]MBZ7976037.1 biosynthetic arginine decarboxylase [Campylobacter sp. RM12637]MBZ7977869.1 biosynthetic arginine decarboxylase [Campylobacter sp. RM12654]MBZ7982053.1 biosynthetic arginine decarboxylase [Campylobacter sp. RM12640]MBZ7983486.1 biosynthetic arginine decarboxylase [Campylobacter sp. RM12647]MBZ7988891.1 biosynthetic arginine decarboxylase [Campylobacter sp. RM12635]MBZ7991031.1 biosynthetic arginine d